MKTTKHEEIINILHAYPDSVHMTKGGMAFSWNTRLDKLQQEAPEILPLLENIFINDASELLQKEHPYLASNISVLLQDFFKESAKYQPQKMSSVLLALPDIVQNEALGAIYRLWGPLNINGFDENGKKVMDKELWLTWLQLAEKQESLEWGIQFMKDEIEKGLLLLTPS